MCVSRLARLAALRKGPVFRLWLKKSWIAVVSGLAYSLFASQVFPRIARPILRLWYPPVRGRGATWLRNVFNDTWIENPRVGEVLGTVTPIVWLFGFALFMALLETRIRPAIEGARKKSAELEKEAVARIRAGDPAGSCVLLKEALRHAGDPKDEQRLADRLAGLRSGVSASPLVNGRYRLLEPLGRGGMGAVWRAHDESLDRAVALKEMHVDSEPDARERFRREARALARLTHPNIVQVYDLVEDARTGRVWIAMELAASGDLDARLKEGALPIGDAIDIGLQIASALASAHQAGILHRDVKPKNVLLAENGRALVADFGLASLPGTATALTMTGMILGTPHYLSPEQAAGNPAGAASDVYSLGATLFQLLAGRTPFQGDPMQLLCAHATMPPPPLRSVRPDASPALESLVLRMLAKSPADRPTLADVQRELAAERDSLRLRATSGATVAEDDDRHPHEGDHRSREIPPRQGLALDHA